MLAALRWLARIDSAAQLEWSAIGGTIYVF
jgi:hypothetical protein